MKSKSQKVREYFQKHPLATPKEVGAKFKVAMPIVYKIRKEVMPVVQEENAKEIVLAKPFVPSNRADDLQVGGDHYKTMGVQPWNVVDTWPREQRIGYYRGGALKYIMRMGSKDESPTEIAKGKHYMEKLLETLGSND